MEIMGTWDLEGNFNGSLVLPEIYMTSSDSGVMIESNGEIADSRDINADSMCTIDEAHFELPLYSTAETSWYYSSSEDIDRFYQLDHCNISHGRSHPQSFNAANGIILAPQSAFGSYLRPSLYAKTGRQNLMKRCFQFLRKVEEKRREVQRLTHAANIQEQHEFNAPLQNKAAFHHMIAERNRRVELKHQFSLLHSLLPHKSKKDKYSILSNTFKYMSELKRQVDELEQRNRALEESLKINISNNEGYSHFNQRHEENQATLVYSSDEVPAQRVPLSSCSSG